MHANTNMKYTLEKKKLKNLSNFYLFLTALWDTLDYSLMEMYFLIAPRIMSMTKERMMSSPIMLKFNRNYFYKGIASNDCVKV